MQIHKRLLSPDEAVGGDPMDADVGDKELTKFPLLQGDRVMRFEIRKPSMAAGKKNAAQNVLTVPCYTTTDAVGIDGKSINKGWPVYMRIGVTPTEKRDAKKIAADIGRLCQAVGVKGVKVSAVIADPVTHLDGKLFDAKVKVVPENEGFPESNSLSPIPLS